MSIETEYQDRMISLTDNIKNPVNLLKDFEKLTEIVTRDADKCVDISNDHLGDQTWQRLVVRTAFSIIDSICFKLNELVYCLLKFQKHAIPEEEEAFLIGYRKNNNGKINRYYPGLSEYVKRSLKISSHFSASSPIDFSNNQWQVFLDSIEIRDRITHPKHPANLSISPQEYDMVANAYLWFQERIMEIVVALSGVAKLKWKQN